ncbi:hypothetical protein BO71DRAFT_426390 [Aspergillus ellipticus CBS 707.79]|uniref:Uncharacterized protein n=1 Tax=Aspergillus ellipticus CBS 707.79 TaxID=1448320 RepID=A0A319DLK3_9EURO|nr:hypothetical protein BO71DRAFT_426390 [Aspergillus ellipticus CBS 707.79]
MSQRSRALPADDSFPLGTGFAPAGSWVLSMRVSSHITALRVTWLTGRRTGGWGTARHNKHMARTRKKKKVVEAGASGALIQQSEMRSPLLGEFIRRRCIQGNTGQPQRPVPPHYWVQPESRLMQVLCTSLHPRLSQSPGLSTLQTANAEADAAAAANSARPRRCGQDRNSSTEVTINIREILRSVEWYQSFQKPSQPRFTAPYVAPPRGVSRWFRNANPQP